MICTFVTVLGIVNIYIVMDLYWFYLFCSFFLFISLIHNELYAGNSFVCTSLLLFSNN